MKLPIMTGYKEPIVQDLHDKLTKVLRKISFGSQIPDPANPGKVKVSNTEPDRNVDCWKLAGTAPAANTDFTLTHGLGRIPTTIVGQHTDNGGLIYKGSVAWTTTQVTLKSTVAGSNYVIILG